MQITDQRHTSQQFSTQIPQKYFPAERLRTKECVAENATLQEMDMGIDEPWKNRHAPRPHDRRLRRFRKSACLTHFQNSGSLQQDAGSENGSSPGSVNQGPTPDPDQVRRLRRSTA